ncbi:MAG: tetratricopeptide repeat protein, partial [Candidatus Hydrogenedentes bacterium]|nr:tetratricopeptide repeat protein [Candidatus Hydrogenedentota bacterium]
MKPVVHLTSLNFEHIFSGAAADNERSLFTPRTDPMRFCIEAPGVAHVYWPAEGSSWDMESEMVYRFDGKDAIDIAFYTTPGEEAFPMGYVGFMWASYQSNFADHTLHFPGISEGKEQWVSYGPTIDKGRFGGTIAFQGVPELPSESGAYAFNVIAEEHIFFTKPLYYGLLDMSVPESSQQKPLTFAMMFDQEAPIRFSVWNWGEPPKISAWDWQYVVQNPKPGKRVGCHARMVCAKLDVPDDVLSRYQQWRVLSAAQDELPSDADTYPDMPIYWSPSHTFFNSIEMGICMEQHNPDCALRFYREVLLTMDDVPRIAAKLDDLLSRVYGEERRVEEWLYIRKYRKSRDDVALPILLLGRAYREKGDLQAAIEVLEQGLAEHPNNAPQLFFYGELLLEAGEGS